MTAPIVQRLRAAVAALKSALTDNTPTPIENTNSADSTARNTTGN
jgi:hypothetical protein